MKVCKQIPIYVAFLFTATLDLASQTAVNKQWRYIWVSLCVRMQLFNMYDTGSCSDHERKELETKRHRISWCFVRDTERPQYGRCTGRGLNPASPTGLRCRYDVCLLYKLFTLAFCGLFIGDVTFVTGYGGCSESIAGR